MPQKNTNEKDCESDAESRHSVWEFYKDCNILITGGTGFLGKTILEKLLRCCESINSIYLMVRPKRGATIEERLSKTLESHVFDLLKETKPHVFDKIKLFYGDITETNFGINETDRNMLIENINIVFHSAASVRLDGSLSEAVRINTLGTKQMLDLCNNMKNLKTFVYMSTAYANCHRVNVEEKVYDANPRAIIELTQKYSEEDVARMKNKLVGPFFNTYAYTKFLSENLVTEYSQKFHVVIIRPSMVTSTWKEPLPAWIDNAYSANSVVCAIGIGLVRANFMDVDVNFDIIPVDIVVNATIAAAWHSSCCKKEDICVYHVTSAEINKITLGEFISKTLKYARKFPTKYAIWYPRHNTTNINKVTGYFYQFIVQRLLAQIFDAVLKLQGKEPRLSRALQKFEGIVNSGRLALVTNFTFKSDNFKALIKDVKRCKDGDDFNIDMSKESGFDWDLYFAIYIKGLWKHLWNDDVDKNEKNKTAMRRLYWMDIGLKICLATSVLMCFMSVLCMCYNI